MQRCLIIYYSMAALPVSSDIFARHQEHLNCIQEHLNCITASDITHVLPPGIMGVLELTSSVPALP